MSTQRKYSAVKTKNYYNFSGNKRRWIQRNNSSLPKNNNSIDKNRKIGFQLIEQDKVEINPTFFMPPQIVSLLKKYNAFYNTSSKTYQLPFKYYSNLYKDIDKLLHNEEYKKIVEFKNIILEPIPLLPLEVSEKAKDEHDGVGQVAALDEVTADERFQFMEEHEGAARCNLGLEIFHIVQRSILFIKHLCVVLHLDVNLESVARIDGQLDAQNLVFIGNRLFDDKIIARCILLDDARLMDGLDKIFRAAVHDGSFFHINVNQHVINTHSAQRRQDMLDGVNLHTAFAEGGSTGCIDDVIDIGFDDRLIL